MQTICNTFLLIKRGLGHCYFKSILLISALCLSYVNCSGMVSNLGAWYGSKLINSNSALHCSVSCDVLCLLWQQILWNSNSSKFKFFDILILWYSNSSIFKFQDRTGVPCLLPVAFRGLPQSLAHIRNDGCSREVKTFNLIKCLRHFIIDLSRLGIISGRDCNSEAIHLTFTAAVSRCTFQRQKEMLLPAT